MKVLFILIKKNLNVKPSSLHYSIFTPDNINILMKKILFFASGNGSNVENILDYFKQDTSVLFVGIMTNNPKAGVIERANRRGVPITVFDKTSFTNGSLLSNVTDLDPDLIVLAGFLWKIGSDWITAFPDKIINIHPALLPKYGGKGMYGNFVHQAVKANEEKKTGITIHYVNEEYDQGAYIFQATVELKPSDNIEIIAEKVHQLEYFNFPRVIEGILKKNKNVF